VPLVGVERGVDVRGTDCGRCAQSREIGAGVADCIAEVMVADAKVGVPREVMTVMSLIGEIGET